MPKKAHKHLIDGVTYYRLHNSGVDKRIIFNSKEDYDRFEAYLYLLNAVESQRAANFFTGNRASEIFTSARGEKLVAIGAYSFVPKNFYILATPLVDGGIAKFMQKLQTAYTMFFNLKYQREGGLFQSSYKSEIAESDAHLKYLFASVHLNPAVLFDENWETADDAQLSSLARRAADYRYSSMSEYMTEKYVITSPDVFPKYISRASEIYAQVKWWTALKNKR